MTSEQWKELIAERELVVANEQNRASLRRIESLRSYAEKAEAALADLQNGGGCHAGKGRGDCEHFVGLPGKSIPGQHDGPDDTVDEYGKPNGWCWQCWKSHQLADCRSKLARVVDALKEITRSGPVFDAKGTWSERVCNIANAALAAVKEAADGPA